MKKVSLQDISQELGVSKSLVSFVMNGRAKEMRVSDSMSKKIMAKAEELGYKANHLARALRTGKSYTLGLIVADIANPFFSKLARSIENEAIKFNYSVIFGSSDESSEKSKNLMDVFLDKKVDGLIICPSANDKKHLVQLHENKVPFVLVDRYFSDIKSNVVIVNNGKGAEEIIENHIKKGYKRIAFVGNNLDLINAQLRLEGYKEALKRNKIVIDELLIKEVLFNGIEENSQKAIQELLSLDPPIESIFFANNHLTSIGIRYIKDFNKSNDFIIDICSFDGFDLIELMDISMVYGVQPIDELGQKSVDLMMELIKSEKNSFTKYELPLEIRE